MSRFGCGSTAGGARYGWAQTRIAERQTPVSSVVEDLSPKYHCNLECKWATSKPSCIRSRKSLQAFFKKHGRFNIVRPEYAGNYPECPMCELKD